MNWIRMLSLEISKLFFHNTSFGILNCSKTSLYLQLTKLMSLLTWGKRRMASQRNSAFKTMIP